MRIRRISRALSLLLVCGFTAACQSPVDAPGREIDAELGTGELVRRYGEPFAYLTVAKRLRDDGHPLLAYFVMEHVRRTCFPAADFDRAFRQVFTDRDFHPEETEASLIADLEADPKSPRKAARLGTYYVVQERWDAAEALLERAARLAPDDYFYTEKLAAYRSLRGRPEAAGELLDRFVAEHPESVAAYMTRFESLFESDRGAAEALIRDGIEKHPESGELYFNLGVLRDRAGDPDAAEAAFFRAAELNDRWAEIPAEVGRFLLKRREKPMAALDAYLKAYFLDPHAYESEHVESRIRHIVRDDDPAEFERLATEARTLADCTPGG